MTALGRFEAPLGLGTVHFAKPARSSRYSHPRSTGAVAASAQRCSRTEFSGWVRRCSLNVRQQGVQPEGPPAPLCSQDHDQMPARCQMRRRELLLMATAMMGAPAVRAQLKAIPVVGFLGSTGPGPYALNMAAFREGLAEAGYVDGPDVALEYRWAEDHHDRPGLAADLIDRKVNVIATGSIPSALAAKQATSTIPIVFETGIDPVEAGLVTELLRPGGKLQGVCMLTAALMPQRVVVLFELVPGASAFGLLLNPN